MTVLFFSSRITWKRHHMPLQMMLCLWNLWQFDSRLKENGLKFKVDLAYVKEHANPSPPLWKHDNRGSRFIANNLGQQIQLTLCSGLHNSERKDWRGNGKRIWNSQEDSPAQQNILKLEHARCETFCNVCFDSKHVCEECKKEHMCYIPFWDALITALIMDSFVDVLS